MQESLAELQHLHACCICSVCTLSAQAHGLFAPILAARVFFHFLSAVEARVPKSWRSIRSKNDGTLTWPLHKWPVLAGLHQWTGDSRKGVGNRRKGTVYRRKAKQTTQEGQKEMLLTLQKIVTKKTLTAHGEDWGGGTWDEKISTNGRQHKCIKVQQEHYADSVQGVQEAAVDSHPLGQNRDVET